MIVFLNGQFVPEEQALVSVFDRGFLYGDGLFETIRVYRGRPFRWAQHLERLRRGAEYLRIDLPFSADDLERPARDLIQRNALPESILRLSLSRGVGPRGYSPRGAHQPTWVMSLHPAPHLDPQCPPRWRLAISSLRVPTNDPIAQHKTCNKLHQVLARVEAEAQGADEALLLNTDGQVAEGASGNLFWIDRGTVCTTPLASGVLPGVTRALVLEICQALKLQSAETSIYPEALRNADGVFLTVTSLGIIEVVSLDGHPLKESPISPQMRAAYQQAIEREINI